jgi:hypothetical protein
MGTPALFNIDLSKLVPAGIAQKDIECMCYRSGVVTNGQINPVMKPILPYITKYGKINSLYVVALALDTLALAKYAYTKAGSLNEVKAANVLSHIGSAKNVPLKSFYEFYGINVGYTPTNHAPSQQNVANSKSAWALGYIAPFKDGGFKGVNVVP